MRKSLVWCGAVLALLIGCSPATSGSGGAPAPKMFITGNVQTSSSNYALTKPAYWKDGTLTVLDTGSYTNGEATGWTSPDNGTTIYIAGNVRNGTGAKVPAYWNNGVLNLLAIPTANASFAAEVDGITRDTQGHLYINGYISSSSTAYTYLPGYWKDGTWVGLPMTSLPSPFAASTGTIGYALDRIAIDANNHVYVSGYIVNPTTGGKNVPVYWLDGVVNVVSLPSGATNGGEVQGTMLTSSASGANTLSTFTILVRGMDAANYSPLSAYVQGSTLTPITTNTLSGAATNGAVWYLSQSPSGDLYATGQIGASADFWTVPTQPPVYWKNWTLTALPGISGQPYGQTGGAIFSGGKVYINGTTYPSGGTGQSSPVYWQDEQVHQLSLTAGGTTYVGGYTYDLGFLN